MTQGKGGLFGDAGWASSQGRQGMTPRRDQSPQTGGQADDHAQQTAGARPAAPPSLDSYYSNCVMVATSHREISILFGRYLTPPPHMTDAPPLPVFAKQIFMTAEQAEELARALQDAVEAFRSRSQK